MRSGTETLSVARSVGATGLLAAMVMGINHVPCTAQSQPGGFRAGQRRKPGSTRLVIAPTPARRERAIRAASQPARRRSSEVSSRSASVERTDLSLGREAG
jgi:hypothetical protein